MNQQEIELYNLYDLWYEPFWHKPWFLLVIVSVALLMVALLLFWLIKIRKKTKQRLKEPGQEALDQLTMLQQQVHECKSVVSRKQFYSNLTRILKRYLVRRYGFALESKTDEEVVLIIRNSEFPIELFKSLSTVFNGALYIKFAHQDAAFDQMNQDLDQVVSIIKLTSINPPS